VDSDESCSKAFLNWDVKDFDDECTVIVHNLHENYNQLSLEVTCHNFFSALLELPWHFFFLRKSRLHKTLLQKVSCPAVAGLLDLFNDSPLQ
jgi:hypothetical protein